MVYADIEVRRQKSREYNAAHRELVNERARAWSRNNKERARRNLLRSQEKARFYRAEARRLSKTYRAFM